MPQHRYIIMDYVRYFLAISVVIAHYNTALGANISWPMSSATAVGAFFGLSGFLVYANYLKHHNTLTYIKNRALRIIPIYSFIVVFFAVLLCTISSLSIIEYFTDITFWKYIIANLCFLNFLQPTLPGVFDNLSIVVVNGSLWTLKIEWSLYLSIPVLFWLERHLRLRIQWSIYMLILFSVAYRYILLAAYNKTGDEFYYILSYQFCGQLIYFYAGVLFYNLRHHLIKYKASVMIVTTIIITCFSFLNDHSSMAVEILSHLLFPVSLVWLTLTLCTLPAEKLCIPAISNYSYEIYLCHLPIIQIGAYFGIRICISDFSLPLLWAIIFAFAYISSNIIRKLQIQKYVFVTDSN